MSVRRWMVFVFACLLLVVPWPAAAQEATPEAPVIVVEDGGVVNVEQPAPEAEGGTLTTVLLFVGALLVAVLWLLDRANKRLADSVPPDAMVLLRTAAAALETLAERTPSKLDDDVVRLLMTLLGPEDGTPDGE